MFHAIRQPIQDRMRYLEELQAREYFVPHRRFAAIRRVLGPIRRALFPRREPPAEPGTEVLNPHTQLPPLHQVPPETGRFLALMAAMAPEGACLEIGTSAGYSALWLATAWEPQGRKLTTFEISPAKIALARETFRVAQIENMVTLVEGNVRERLSRYDNIAFCFLDTDKSLYGECYETVVPRLVKGGLLVADNILSHQEEVRSVVERALADERVDALVLPIGTGELVCRKT